MSILTKVLTLSGNFPLIRGMVSYGISWPSCSIAQEYIEHGTPPHKADLSRAGRFAIFGSFFMAPVFYTWMRYSSRFFVKRNFLTAVKRASIEQVTYTPIAMAYFFFGMSVLESKDFEACCDEVKEKLWPTYRIGVVFWPIVQTVNFYFVPEKNRIIFVSAASFVWTVFMAHMKGNDKYDDVKEI